TFCTVVAGIVMPLRCRPAVLMPRNSPELATSGPPEKPGYNVRSGRMNWSSSPFRHVRQGPGISPERIPELATTFPRQVRPKARTNSPTRKLPVENQDTEGASMGCSSRSTAMSVPASRPASCALSFCPGPVTMAISSSRRTAWLAVTTASGRKITPLEGCRCPRTATTDLPAVAAAPASSLESAVQILSAILLLLLPCFHITMEQPEEAHIGHLARPQAYFAGPFADKIKRNLKASSGWQRCTAKSRLTQETTIFAEIRKCKLQQSWQAQETTISSGHW